MATFKRTLPLGLFSLVIAFATMASASSSALASSKSCSELTDELKSMHRAQTQLLESMVHKNESMASTLDQYAQNFSQQNKVRKADVVSLRKSAMAFRNHEGREQKLVQRFEKKTGELVEMIASCLQPKSLAAQ